LDLGGKGGKGELRVQDGVEKNSGKKALPINAKKKRRFQLKQYQKKEKSCKCAWRGWKGGNLEKKQRSMK